jgi:hypothetical protein
MVLRVTTSSYVDCAEVIENADRKFGSADRYFPALVRHGRREVDTGEVDADGSPVVLTQHGDYTDVALFTEAQIRDALKRGAANKEDVEAWLTGERKEAALAFAMLTVGLGSAMVLAVWALSLVLP